MAVIPRVVDPQHPLVQRVREIAMAFPETVEIESWGRPTFRAGKRIFIVVGASHEQPFSIIFKPTADERRAYLERGGFWIPPYWGPGGWLAAPLDSRVADWTELAEIVDNSYRLVALTRQIKALDSRPSKPLV